MNDSILVAAKELSKTFTIGSLEVPALRGVNFQLRQGEFAALVGPSGSGKSTLLNLIGALDSISGGELLVLDREISKLSK
ncbi:MAG: ATP-binding cassette domain-containing protein, partial [Oryzomonas sp.]